jgi:hypothetical protein
VIAEPYYTPERTRECLGGTVRVFKTATNNWIVQHQVAGKWYYADSPFWLDLTPDELSDIQQKYMELSRPAKPSEPITESLESLL